MWSGVSRYRQSFRCRDDVAFCHRALINALSMVNHSCMRGPETTRGLASVSDRPIACRAKTSVPIKVAASDSISLVGKQAVKLPLLTHHSQLRV